MTTEAPTAPGAETVQTTQSVPNRKNRYSYFPDGDDYVLLSVARDPNGQPLPGGALSAIPETPRFGSLAEAKRWVTASGERLAGLTVVIAKMCIKLAVAVVNKPQISVVEEVRFERPQKEEAEEEVPAEPAPATEG